MTDREQLIKAGADAIQTRIAKPGPNRAGFRALAHRDVAVAIATAVVDSAPTVQPDGSPSREQRVRAGADAVQARSTWPSMHWPNISALAHRDMAEGVAAAVIDAITPALAAVPVNSVDLPTAEDALFELRASATSDRAYMTPEGFDAALAVVIAEQVQAALGVVETAPGEPSGSPVESRHDAWLARARHAVSDERTILPMATGDKQVMRYLIDALEDAELRAERNLDMATDFERQLRELQTAID